MSDEHPGRPPRAPRSALIGAAALLLAAAALAGAGRAGAADGRLGPGDAHTVVRKSGYTVELTITPNIAGRIASTFRVALTRAGRPVTAAVTARFTMQAMAMPSLRLRLEPARPGLYAGSGEKLTMPGRWEILLHIAPRHGSPLDVSITDVATVE